MSEKGDEKRCQAKTKRRREETEEEQGQQRRDFIKDERVAWGTCTVPEIVSTRLDSIPEMNRREQQKFT